MFIIRNFILALAHLLESLISIYILVLIVRAFMSWFNPNPYHPVAQFLYRITEPVLSVVRRYLPVSGGFDFSPLVIILVLYFLRNFLVKSLFEMALILH
jgi:YggT family protein